MNIYDISIKNFRGIVELNNLKVGDVNSFVGKNDSGKSTILRALDAFFNDNFSITDVYLGIQGEEKTVVQIRFELPEEINSLALDSDGKFCLIKEFSIPKNGRAVKEMYCLCYDFVDEAHHNCWSKTKQDLHISLDALGIEYKKSSSSLGKIEKLTEISSMDRTELKFIAADTIKNLDKSYDFFEIPEFSLFDAEQDLNVASTDFQKQFKPIAQQALEKNKSTTDIIEENVRNDLENEFDQITKLMKKNAPDLEKIMPNVTCNWAGLVKFDLALKFENDVYDIPISNKGTGFKRLLMVAYFEYLAQKQSKKYQIFGVEEPETFLHPGLQNDLLQSILDLSEHSQFFITTHSPIFAGATKESNIVVVKKVDEISNYYNHENATDILDEVIQELGIRPNFNLLNENIDKVIFVEGAGDVKFWEIAIRKIEGELPTNILFVPCGGSQVEFFVNSRLCQKINRRFIFIVDSDKNAVDYESKLQTHIELKQKVEDLNGTFEILAKREIENYYHPNAIQRILGDAFQLPDDFEITDYIDVKEELKLKIIEPSSINFKTKNNMDVFETMTREEWIEVGTPDQDSTDIQRIINVILY